MPVYVPAKASVPGVSLPDLNTADLVGVATVAGIAAEYKSRVTVSRRQSNITFIQKERIGDFSRLLYGSSAIISIAGANDLDFTVEDFHSYELVGNVVFQLPTMDTGLGRTAVLCVQDSVGGRTVTWPAAVKWSGGAPVVTPGAGAVSLIEFVKLVHPVTFAVFLYGVARLNYL